MSAPMPVRCLAAFGLFAWATTAVAQPFGATVSTEKLAVGGADREYRLVVPDSLRRNEPAPLLFAFHGMLIDSPELMPKYSRLDELAKRHGFLLVYPGSTQRKSWALGLK